MILEYQASIGRTQMRDWVIITSAEILSSQNLLNISGQTDKTHGAS